MEKILIFIKHHFGFLWIIIEWLNGIIFQLLFKSRMDNITAEIFAEVTETPYSYRKLITQDIESLYNLINSQNITDLKYFNPHKFDLKAIQRQFKSRSFLMMGVFEKNKMVGYFFLRFFSNKKCFVGRLIDKDYRGLGIGPVMNNIMYEIAWRLGFRCLSTISKNNTAVMHAHVKNPAMIVLKELQNNYLLVEFVRKASENGIKGQKHLNT
jgi:hypothetical protein